MFLLRNCVLEWFRVNVTFEIKLKTLGTVTSRPHRTHSTHHVIKLQGNAFFKNWPGLPTGISDCISEKGSKILPSLALTKGPRIVRYITVKNTPKYSYIFVLNVRITTPHRLCKVRMPSDQQQQSTKILVYSLRWWPYKILKLGYGIIVFYCSVQTGRRSVWLTVLIVPMSSSTGATTQRNEYTDIRRTNLTDAASNHAAIKHHYLRTIKQQQFESKFSLFTCPPIKF